MKQVTMWVTADGRPFYTQEAAEAYEDIVKLEAWYMNEGQGGLHRDLDWQDISEWLHDNADRLGRFFAADAVMRGSKPLLSPPDDAPLESGTANAAAPRHPSEVEEVKRRALEEPVHVSVPQGRPTDAPPPQPYGLRRHGNSND